MASQRLETIIAINARVGNGFSAIGSTLMQMGAMVDGISDKLINFGKESVEVYRNYEMSMSDAEVALSTTYGRGTRELSDVMSQLDAAATEWAASTIFHTDDVANAISEAAHANWNLEQIMSGIPAAMELAQAGSMDLSEAVNFVVKATNAAGIEFDDAGTFIDHWTFAANSSATTIEEMGDAMLRMGSTMKFTGGMDELLVMLAELANAGTVGSEAGTLLRNSMIRMVAPTDKAKDAMAALGATSDEAMAAMQDEALAAANARLEAVGFSAYDENGNLKSMLDTYRDLYVALGDIAGGYDKIAKNDESLEILSAIFPTRSITGALALLEAAGKGYHGLYEALKEGDADDYGEYAADRMMDTLNGKIETFESKLERLKQLVGEELSGPLEDVLDSLGGIVDNIATLPEGQFDALVSVGTTLAGAGPGLIIAGKAFQFIGNALSLRGGIALGAIAAIAAAEAMQKIKDFNFADKFGSIELDATEIQAYTADVSQAFHDAYDGIIEYRDALDDTVTTYTTASGELKSDLITNMLTGSKLSDEDKEKLSGLGEEIIQSVKDGIELNTAANMESVTNAFGGQIEAQNNPIWAQIIDVMELGHDASVAKAEELGQQLRDAMTSAFSDGHLTSDEIANIQSIMDEQNELLAQQQDVENYVERQRILRKAQTLGLDAIEDAVAITKEERDAEWEAAMDEQSTLYAQTAAYYDSAIKNGWEIENTDGTAEKHVATQADKEAALAAVEQQSEQRKNLLTASNQNLIFDTMLEGMKESKLSSTWSEVVNFASAFRQAGGIVTPQASQEFNSAVNPKEVEQVSRYVNMMMENLGGYENVLSFQRTFASEGDTLRAGQYQSFLDIYDLIGGGIKANAEIGTRGNGDYNEVSGSYQELANILSGYSTSLTPEGLIESMHLQTEEWGMQAPDWSASLGNDDLYRAIVGAALNAGFEGKDNDVITQWLTELEAQNPQVEIDPVVGEIDGDVEPQEMEIIPEVDQSALSVDPLVVPIQPKMEGADAAEQLQDQGVTVDVDGDTQRLSATIQGEDGKTLMEYVDGNADQLTATITPLDGTTLTETVTGNATLLAQTIESYNGRTITVNIAGNKMFASGGRATTASIFGEAGPEWAIPEEHSQRTADLLNAAREASGFTWPDLLSMYGGLNANTENTPTTIIYSPTVNAQDATGVDQVLQADKQRLDKWWEEKKMRDEVEVYA